jgi:hypothetical protein
VSIKILSGHSEKGGSTTAFINLTNELNKRGIDCTFYGPHTWHLDKCKSDILSNLMITSDDVIILHFIKLRARPMVKRVIFVCHEKWWWSFENLPNFFDSCVFLHQEHRDFHKSYVGDFSIIPNLKEDLKPVDKTDKDLIAGIVGTIEERKQTHISIQQALNDGCQKVLLYGHIANEEYFNNFVKDYLSDERVQHIGFSTNKQQMYDSIGRVYHLSKGEVACLVKDECFLTNTKFFGNSETMNEVSPLNNDEIINLWIKELQL